MLVLLFSDQWCPVERQRRPVLQVQVTVFSMSAPHWLYIVTGKLSRCMQGLLLCSQPHEAARLHKIIKTPLKQAEGFY